MHFLMKEIDQTGIFPIDYVEVKIVVAPIRDSENLLHEMVEECAFLNQVGVSVAVDDHHEDGVAFAGDERSSATIRDIVEFAGTGKYPFPSLLVHVFSVQSKRCGGNRNPRFVCNIFKIRHEHHLSNSTGKVLDSQHKMSRQSGHGGWNDKRNAIATGKGSMLRVDAVHTPS